MVLLSVWEGKLREFGRGPSSTVHHSLTTGGLLWTLSSVCIQEIITDDESENVQCTVDSDDVLTSSGDGSVFRTVSMIRFMSVEERIQKLHEC